MMIVRKGCNNLWIVKFSTSWLVGFQQFLFLSYYFFEFADFFFQETYNTRLQKRHRDDLSTLPKLDSDLWLKTGSSGGSNWNQVYGISNNIAKDLYTIWSVLTVGYSQSVSSIQTSKFEVILNQWVEVQMTHLTAETKQLSAETIELWRMYMKLKSQINGTCVPPYWPYGSNEDPPSPPPTPLFQLNCIWTNKFLKL